MTERNIDQAEIEKFEALARRWWDRNGEFRPLHDINPLRVGYITDRVDLNGRRVLDVGCGGGILSEALSAAGADVLGIDPAEAPLNIARLHRHESNLSPGYELTTVEELAATSPEPFDVITCLEMLEHVPDPASVIRACRMLLKDDGHLFLATINRNPRAYLSAIVGAEYILNLLPRGTHDYDKLIKPAELAAFCRQADLDIEDFTGMTYNPITKRYKPGRDVGVNYLAYARPV